LTQHVYAAAAIFLRRRIFFPQRAAAVDNNIWLLVGAPPISGLRIIFLSLTVVRQCLAVMLATADYF